MLHTLLHAAVGLTDCSSIVTSVLKQIDPFDHTSVFRSPITPVTATLYYYVSMYNQQSVFFSSFSLASCLSEDQSVILLYFDYTLYNIYSYIYMNILS